MRTHLDREHIRRKDYVDAIRSWKNGNEGNVGRDGRGNADGFYACEYLVCLCSDTQGAQETVVYWSKYQFDSQQKTLPRFVEHHRLVENDSILPYTTPYEQKVTAYINQAIKDKESVHDLFAEEMASHFRRAAAICGMMHPGGMDNMVKIILAIDMGKSIVHDHSEDNIERLCWLLYCSTNTVHKTVFGKEMTEHYEVLLMDRLGVSYKEDDAKVGKGCVSMLFNKMLNDYRGGVSGHLRNTGKCDISSVCSNTPRGCTPVKGKGPIFWVEKKVATKVEWSTVSEKNCYWCEWSVILNIVLIATVIVDWIRFLLWGAITGKSGR